jgi:two-component system sensor histidine kinase TctE
LQLLGWLLGPLVLLLAVNAFFSNRASVITANAAFDRLLTASADAIADQITVQDGALQVDLPYVALQLLESRLQEQVFYRVLGPDGYTLTGYDDLPLPPPKAPRNREGEVLYATGYRGGPVHAVALYRTVYGGATPQAAVVVVAETGESRDALSRQIWLEGLARQGVLIVAAALLVWFGLGRGLRPLLRLRDSLLARAAADRSPIDTSGVQTEVRPLIEALNHHNTQLDQLIATRQRFIADASHQMRTPLAEMRTQIDVSLRQGGPELAQQTLADLRHGIDALARTIGQMLLLARTEPEALDAAARQPVVLATLARDTALEWVAAARKKAIDLSVDSTFADEATVQGHALLLHELLANLLDNAIRYSPPRAEIVVRVRALPQPMLEVEDNGPGIAADERERVFERFYRGRQVSAPGSGLGLAIVREIAASHGARVELATPASGHGLLVRVRWLSGLT